MSKNHVLTFVLGAILGSGITWYFFRSETMVLTTNKTEGPFNSPQNQKSAPVGQEVSVGENVSNVIDNSERTVEAEGPAESESQMDQFARSIATENEEAQAPVADETSAVAPEEAPPEIVPEEPESNSEEETK